MRLFILFLFPALSYAIELPVDQMTGCFQVKFGYNEWNFETAAPMPRYEESLIEKIEVDIDDEGHYRIIHYGIVNNQQMPHWQELWIQSEDLVWERRVLSAGGGERYRCLGTLELTPSGSYKFDCGYVDAPMPRRDQLANRDYDVIRRRHELIYGASGYVDVQSNLKIRGDEAVGQESGWNHYEMVEEEACSLR